MMIAQLRNGAIVRLNYPAGGRGVNEYIGFLNSEEHRRDLLREAAVDRMLYHAKRERREQAKREPVRLRAERGLLRRRSILSWLWGVKSAVPGRS